MTGWDNIGTPVRENEPLAMHTWFGLGGNAEFYAQPETQEELIELIKCCDEKEIPVRLLGSGANILVRDEGVPGMVVHLGQQAFRAVTVDGTTVTAGGGAPLSRLITTSVYSGLAGLEMLVGIPGTVGGALHGNTGAHGGSIGQWVASVTVLDAHGEIHKRTGDELQFSYRQSSLNDLVILEATFELRKADPKKLGETMQKNWIVRKSLQPLGHQSAERIFKDPRGQSASQLIENVGLGGAKIGGAVVSQQHPGFFIAEPDATSEDVLRLIELVQNQVRDRLEIELELEIEVW